MKADQQLSARQRQSQAHITNFENTQQKQLSYFLEPISSINQNIITMTIHVEIHNVISDLDDKIDGMIVKHEKDFMAAYRGHMLKIQKELVAMKKKCSEQEFALRRDEKIMSLERQLEWFRSEALNLSKLYKHHTREAESLRQKNETLEEEKQFLMMQITKQKRQSKLLKMALGKTQDNCSQLIQYQRDIKKGLVSSENLNDKNNMQLALYNLTEDSEQASPQGTLERNLASQLKSQKLIWDEDTVTSYDVVKKILDKHSNLEKDRLAYEISKVVDSKQDQLNQKIQRLKSRNEILEKEYKKLKSVNGDRVQQDSYLQKIFVECIESVRKDIEKRKLSQQNHQPFSNGSQKSKTPSNFVELDMYTNFQQFQLVDKQKVLELLISNDDYLKFIYDSLFQIKQKIQIDLKTISVENHKFLDRLESERETNSQSMIQNPKGQYTPQILNGPSQNLFDQRDSLVDNQSNLFIKKKQVQNSLYKNYNKLIGKTGGFSDQDIFPMNSVYSVSRHPMSAKGIGQNILKINKQSRLQMQNAASSEYKILGEFRNSANRGSSNKARMRPMTSQRIDYKNNTSSNLNGLISGLIGSQTPSNNQNSSSAFIGRKQRLKSSGNSTLPRKFQEMQQLIVQ
eukprot:403373603